MTASVIRRARISSRRSIYSGSWRQAGPGAFACKALRLMSHEDGRLVDAMREFDQALALIPRDQDPENYAHTLHNSALPMQVLGRFDEAIERYLRSRARSCADSAIATVKPVHCMAWERHSGKPANPSARGNSCVRPSNCAMRRVPSASRRYSLIGLGQIERDEGNTDTAIALHSQAVALVSAPNDRATCASCARPGSCRCQGLGDCPPGA